MYFNPSHKAKAKITAIIPLKISFILVAPPYSCYLCIRLSVFKGFIFENFKITQEYGGSHGTT